ncbi:MAG: hypothetical protein LBT29_07535 [Flavobacteriaceae bacterium]|jgi:nitrite reductase/ring-hydroxylating ferredoxin subunit|nr:hypothetical protein [Flavobacteriaceae bacterium]
MIKQIFSYIGVFIFCLTAVQCLNEDSTIGCFPNSNINVQINMDLPQYQPLLNIGGWKYVSAGALSGTQGLIVARTGSNEFKAYDRNPPHICPGNNTTLQVVKDIKIVCPEDGAEWMLSSGQPISGAGIPPKMYKIYVSGNILTIVN